MDQDETWHGGTPWPWPFATVKVIKLIKF